MKLFEFLEDPYFESSHRLLASRLQDWLEKEAPLIDTLDDPEACQKWAVALGHGSWLSYAVENHVDGSTVEPRDVRSLCLIREVLARVSPLADFVFVMQGLGSAVISLVGTDSQKKSTLPRIAKGDAIAAFALSEDGAGSDVAALQCSAIRRGDHYVLNGEKSWVSNAPIAHIIVVFARTGQVGAQGISAFIVNANTPGCVVGKSIQLMAEHSIARVSFDDCVLSRDQRLGQEGEGFALAMRALDIFRPSVAAAALGLATCAFEAALNHSQRREIFGQRLSEMQMTCAKLAQMEIEISSARLLTYRAAWQADLNQRITAEAAMAKFSATEVAQRVVDASMQLFGAAGLVKGHILEALYREVRALRIYEGASEIQLLIVARELFKKNNLGS